ncbi:MULTISPECIES: peptidoglycan D,D-transpeptidase FtsI family protein [Pseudanabaena]|uniref:peptidoglycan D,D-transpeptidase FtsI family protein n=1 Tax=Pseudanabaena TaxID=1152 RepID=UPI0024793ECC|nr:MULTISPECIES: penicillin-binding protein 2 [Pseudanabaena]MEA5489860.1 penicillin-binding protein 2 [Pseudanabaena sp. CCNP1317]WGS74150.1 penicillin-binding protein 2 [Pseudanabaena galeata CCNP1313]
MNPSIPPRDLATINLFKRRTVLIWMILALSMIGLIVRLVFLQVVTSSELLEKARRQQMFTLRPFIPRRTITDRKGAVLALDRPVYTLFAHPHLYKEKPEVIAEKLAPILRRPADKLLSILSRDTTSTQVEYWLSEENADRIFNLRVDGLDLVQQRHRLYPQQDLAAELLGYVNVDHRGQAGIELSQEKLLERTDQSPAVTQDGNGKLIPNRIPAGMLQSDRTSLQMTIDSRIQRTARQILKQQMVKFGAKRGSVIVMDARDGGLLSLVTEPTYDPNRYYESDVKLFKNWAVSDLYEPGSTFKPLNVAIALEAGAIQPDTVFNDEGILTIGGWPVANFDYDQVGPVGPLSISQILERSSNVGMVHIVQRMKSSVYYGWLERIGLGDISGIDLPSETPSTLKPQEQFLEYVIEPATASFGQGFSLTPVQMVQLQGILASGGKLLTPHVVKGLINEEGEEYYQPKLATPRQVISPATAQRVVEMMTNVVEKGTGLPARIPGYRIAGKTGTAQKALTTGGGYSNAKITSFVGIFPAKEPRYVVMAVIDEPVGDDAFGSTVAAPIVKTVIEDIIVSEGIPPSHPEEVISKIPILADPTPVPSPASQDSKPSPNNSPNVEPTPSRDRN